MYLIRPQESEDPRKRLLIRALAAGLFSYGLLPGRLAAQGIFGSRPARLPEGQSIYRLAGDVRINDKVATLQTRIGAGDTIETGANAEIVYAVGENAFILRGSSRVSLEGSSGSMLISGFRILTGALLSVFPQKRPLKVTTQTATIGIRGTGVYLESDPRQTYLCTCYGTVDVAATSDQQSRETVVSKYHDNPLYILAGEPSGKNIRRASFLNHTDQELMLIETLVGRTPPFVFPKDEYRSPRRQY